MKRFDKRIDGYMESLAEGKITRRQFITKALAVGVAASSIPTLLAGCEIPTPEAEEGAGPAAEEAQRFDGEKLAIQMWSGAEGDTIQKNIVDPFVEATGVEVIVEYGWTSESIAKIRAQKDDPQIDLFIMDDIGVVTCGREGLLETLDMGGIPNSGDIHPRFFVGDGKGVGFFTYTDTIFYNTDVIKADPTSWEVLWDPAHCGKVTLEPNEWTGALKQVIVAARMNGGSQYDPEPGFEKLEELAPCLHSLAENTATVAELFKSGDLEVGSIVPYVYKEYVDQGYPIGISYDLKEGFFGTAGCLAIVKGKNAKTEVCNALINQALSSQSQEGAAKDLWFGPANTKVSLTEDIGKYCVDTEADYDALIPVDLDHLLEVRQDWIDRLNRIFVL